MFLDVKNKVIETLSFLMGNFFSVDDFFNNGNAIDIFFAFDQLSVIENEYEQA